MNQFLKIIFWSISALFLWSLLTALVAWIFFVIRHKQKKIGIHIQLGDGQKAEAGDVPFVVMLSGTMIRPLIGSVRARVVFSDEKLSESILLDENVRKNRSFFRYAIRGTGKTMLHDRRIYDVNELQLHFYDMFNLVALPYRIPFSVQLYTLPQKQQETEVRINPNTTEEQLQRITVPKRVEGEYLN